MQSIFTFLQISLTDEQRRDTSRITNVFSLNELQEKFPLLKNWREFIEWNLNNEIPISDKELITVPDVNYLQNLTDLIRNTSIRTIANYFGARLAAVSSDLLNEELDKRHDQYDMAATGANKSLPRSTKCIKKNNKIVCIKISNHEYPVAKENNLTNIFRLPISTAAIYIRKYFDKTTKDKVTLLADYIKAEFIVMLTKESWLDNKTRRAAIEKAKAISFNIAYPDEITDNNKLEEYYQGLELQQDSLFHSVLRIRNFSKNKKINGFREPIPKNDWRMIAPQVPEINAMYWPSVNSICKFCNQNIFKS